jgi:hypothetical protein
MDNQKPGQPKPGHTTVESLDLPLALRRCPCADHRQGSRRRSPSAAGACRCATSDPGCPHPRLQPALGTKHKALQHHCLSIDGKAAGASPCVAVALCCMQPRWHRTIGQRPDPAHDPAHSEGRSALLWTAEHHVGNAHSSSSRHGHASSSLRVHPRFHTLASLAWRMVWRIRDCETRRLGIYG